MDRNISMIPGTTEILELRNDKPKVPSDENYIFAATSNNTRKAYQADIRHFIAWGGFLPTSTDVVMQLCSTSF